MSARRAGVFRVERPVSLGTLVPFAAHRYSPRIPIALGDPLPGYATHGVNETITMIADGDASFTKAVGLEIEVDRNALGLRSQRCGVRARPAVDAAGLDGQRDARRPSAYASRISAIV